jgi:hypothetical protein
MASVKKKYCIIIVVDLTSSFHSSFKLAHSCQKKPKLHKNELNTYNVFLFDETPPQGSKSLKIF